MRTENHPIVPAMAPTSNELYSLSPQARRQRRHDAIVEQAYLDGQVQCPRKGPLRPQISVTTCSAMHERAPGECQGCGCRLHLVATVKAKEIAKNKGST